jgi:uncharacterized membrane protein
VGIAIIVLGAAAATLHFLWQAARGELAAAYHEYRANLGRAILLGLEFLVAADIIGTVAVDPTLRNLAVLGGIVVIRTFLSFALQVEIEGRLPWRRNEPGGVAARGRPPGWAPSPRRPAVLTRGGTARRTRSARAAACGAAARRRESPGQRRCSPRSSC